MNGSVVVKFPPETRTNPGPALARPAICVRPRCEDDLAQVADLFLQRFRAARRNARARTAIAQCMKSLYLDHPTREGDADALVAVDSVGAIGAFCGGVRA